MSLQVGFTKQSVEVKTVFFFIFIVKFQGGEREGETEERAVNVGNPHPVQMAKGAKNKR